MCLITNRKVITLVEFRGVTGHRFYGVTSNHLVCPKTLILQACVLILSETHTEH